MRASVVLLIVGSASACADGRRNWTYLQLARGRTVAPAVSVDSASRADRVLALRVALSAADWPSAAHALRVADVRDRLEPMIVVRDAERRVAAGDLAGARLALSVVTANAGADVGLWYRAGETYERAHALDDARGAFLHGAANDVTEPWSYGRYRVSLIDQQAQQWQRVVDGLAPLFRAASDAEIARPIEASDPGGAIWQGCLLALGDAYDHLGERMQAEDTYARLGRIQRPRRDWTLNRGLTYLAREQAAHGDVVAAALSLTRALDVATEFEVSYRRRFELDTAAEAGRVMEQARQKNALSSVLAAIDDAAQRLPQSVGVWWMRGLAAEAACDANRARESYARAFAVVREGAGAFLEGRPSAATTGPCGR